MEYLAFPRLPWYAKISWTKPIFRDWEKYKYRLAKHSMLWSNGGVSYYLSPLVNWEVLK